MHMPQVRCALAVRITARERQAGADVMTSDKTDDAAAASTGGRLAADLRGFGVLGTVVFLLILALALVHLPLDLETAAAAIAILVWARVSHTPLRDIGLARPASWLRVLLIGIVLGIAIKLVEKALILPLLGAPAVNPAAQHLIGRPVRLLISIVYMVVSAGICEEIVYRGYMFERLGRLLGDGIAARLLIVAVSSLVFGLVHYDQGFYSVLNGGIGGLMFGAIYLVSVRQLWLVIVAHAAYDLWTLAIVYFHLEAAVARSVFG
jgi:membrane protease YdiL (CAAX protease family)